MASRRLLALSLLGLAASAPALAQQGQPAPRTVATRGEGEASAAPDHALVSAGAETQARTAREAMDANSRAMRAVQAVLKEAGIAERDVSTSGLSLSPVIDYGAGSSRPRVTGYAAGHRVTVRVNDLAKLGEVLDRMVSAGANQVSGLQLEVSDWSRKMDEARAAAVADARRKAEALAQAAGARLGRVLSIAEQGTGSPPPAPVARMAASSARAEAVPVAAGEQTFRVSVTVTWELAD